MTPGHHARGHMVIVDHMLLPLPVLLAIFGAVLAAAAGLTVSGLVKRRRGKHRDDPVLRAVRDRAVKVEKQIADGSASLRQQVTDLEARFAAERAELEAELAAERKARCALSAGLAQAFGAAGMAVPGKMPAAGRPGLRVIKGGRKPA